MKFIHSSPPDLRINIIKQLDYLLNEQRAQRGDLANILRQLNFVKNNVVLQKQVDEFYETSPQTEQAQNEV